MRSLLHRLLIASWVGWGAVACGGGGNGGNSTTAPIRPLQDLRELSLHAGSLQVGGCGWQDGNGTAASSGAPGPLAIDGSGRIHVMDSYRDVRVVDALGSVTTTYGGPGRAPEDGAEGIRFFPVLPAIAIGGDGSRYFAVLNDLRLPPNYTYAPKGWSIYRASGDGPAEWFADPTRQAQPIEVGNTISGMALDSQGRLLVADTEACAVRRVELDRRVTTLFSTPAASAGPPGCLSIHGLAIGANDELAYVLGDGTLRRRTAAGIERTVAGVTVGPNVHLAFDTGGRLLLSEREAQRVRALDTDGTLSVLASNPVGPERPLALAAPTGVVASPTGQVFVADAINCTISRIQADGRLQVLAGLAKQNGFRDGPGPQARFGPNFRFTTDAQGDAFVADPANRVVRRIDGSGRVSTLAGTPDPSSFDGVYRERSASDLLWAPSTLAPLADGRLLVLDSPDVKVLSLSGEVSSWPPGAASGLGGLALLDMGPGDALHATDGEYRTCYRCGALPSTFGLWNWSAEGSRTKLLDQDSEPSWRLGTVLTDVPRGLAVAADSRVYFTIGHAVYRRDASGTTVRLAGGAEAGHLDGVGTAARFNLPSGIAADPASPDVLYVADSGNHVIRKIDAQGNVSTVMGRPGQAGNVLGAAPAGLDSPRDVRVVPGGLLISTGAAVLMAR